MPAIASILSGSSRTAFRNASSASPVLPRASRLRPSTTIGLPALVALENGSATGRTLTCPPCTQPVTARAAEQKNRLPPLSILTSTHRRHHGPDNADHSWQHQNANHRRQHARNQWNRDQNRKAMRLLFCTQAPPLAHLRCINAQRLRNG